MSTPLSPLKTKLDQERRTVLHRIPATSAVKIAIEEKSDQARFAAKRTQQAITELLKLLSPTEVTNVQTASRLSDKELDSVLKQPLGAGTAVPLGMPHQPPTATPPCSQMDRKRERAFGSSFVSGVLTFS